MPLTFDVIAKIENGARFYTADLHVHTHGGSEDVTDENMTAPAVVDAALKHRIALLAITDHNSDANVIDALDYAQQYAGRLLVLPAVEITTAHGHLLVYFPPDRPENVSNLLGVVGIEGKRGSRDSHTSKSMADVIADAERLGGISVAAHIDREKTGFETAPGYRNWKKDILRSTGLYGLEFDKAEHLAWYSPDDESTTQGAERKKLLQARAQLSSIIARTRLAPVQNSDAHSLADLEAYYHDSLLTRYKMTELSFEGFRTALVDPEARVRDVATIPRSFPRVLGMHVVGGFLDGETIHFSDNLNCFIGGRGTGKSTAIQTLAFGLGSNDSFAEQDNCAANIVVYCEDSEGIRYRYERDRFGGLQVQAKEDRSIIDVPPDAFTVEFYSQGELAEVAKDPLGNPALLQEFLDRHIRIGAALEREQELLEELEQNSAQLIPLEARAKLKPAKAKGLADVNTKLKIAEEGKLKDVAGLQTRVAAERALTKHLRDDVQRLYSQGVSLANWTRDFDQLVRSVGELTGDAVTSSLYTEVRTLVQEANAFVAAQQKSLNTGLRIFGERLGVILSQLDAQHGRFTETIGLKLAEFRRKGLTGDLAGLQRLLGERGNLATELNRITNEEPELEVVRSRRATLIAELQQVRDGMAEERKVQVRRINPELLRAITDYHINVYYDPVGIIDAFHDLIIDVMHGTYFTEASARALCERTTPAGLADCIRRDARGELVQFVGENWSDEFLRRFGLLINLHRLEVVGKPARPIIKVRTKGAIPKDMAVTHLSDGQRHTILLTIAMLAESNLPLIIDQPEDDLDNAFIYSSVVASLRAIKERRQVILVTHNANIAVLGDSELILPMKRKEDRGEVVERGSVDRPDTSRAVQNILEGGELAFKRRKEIYGY